MKRQRDDRPQWELDDENQESHFKLTADDKTLIRAGVPTAVKSGTAAGLILGAGPWLLVLLLRALLGGGWRFDHWIVNLTLYAGLALVLGPAMGALRYWSTIGHRFSMMPMASVRAGWHTWLGMVAIDLMVIIFTTEDRLGVLLIFIFFGLIWLGLLYDLIWTFIQNRLLRSRLFARAQ